VNNLQKEIGDDICLVPLIWIQELIYWQETDMLHILRTPHHKPKNPYELVDFIQRYEDF
jgi:hypothetical protein